MFILIKNIRDLIPYENNPRINDNAVEAVPIIIDTNNTIIAGHTRLKACEKLGINEKSEMIAKKHNVKPSKFHFESFMRI